jgi:hypothetical protein
VGASRTRVSPGPVRGKEEGLDRWAPPISARERKREGRARGLVGQGERLVGHVREGRERRGEGGRGLGCKGRKEREEGRKESGSAQNRKKRGNLNAIQMHLNLKLKFKFK